VRRKHLLGGKEAIQMREKKMEKDLFQMAM